MSDDKFDWNINPGPLGLRLDGPDISTRAFEKPPTFTTGGIETTFQLPTPPPMQMRITQPEPRQLRIPPRVLEIARRTAARPDRLSLSELTYALLEYMSELDEQRKGAPELWAVVAVDEKGTPLHTRAFAHRSEALTKLEQSEPVPGLTFRLARFVGEFVEP